MPRDDWQGDGFAALLRTGSATIRTSRLFIGLIALALGSAAPAQTAGGGVAPPCDRACMTGLVDRYLEALVRHDASGLPLNRDVKFTENAARLDVGNKGLWVAASEVPTGPRIYAIDLAAGQIVGVEAMGAQLPYGTLSGWGE